MNKCKQCGKEYQSKRITSSYCGPKCKQEFYRNRMKGVTVTLVTAKETKSVTVTDPEQDTLKQPSPLEVVEDFTTDGVVFDKPKRGKDIKCFADLPPDVQQTIDSLSMVDGKICQRVKANRTAIAINYQHLFPDRYNSTGATYTGKMTASESEHYKPANKLKSGQYNPVSKPGDADYNDVNRI